MKRREFLKGSLVTGAAGMLFDACAPPGSEKIIPLLIPEEKFIPGVEEFLATTCFECAGGCGLLARKIDGRVVKIEGNPSHPVSGGGSCARGQALPQALYHPDRLREPLLRDGERGEGKWHAITWDDAIGRLASELSVLQKNKRANFFGFLTGAFRGHRLEFVRRFASVFGSSRHLIHEPFDTSVVRKAHARTTGRDEIFSYDLEHANYVITFGGGLLDATRSPVRFARGLGHLRQGRPGRRGKFVAVESRLSQAAANADEWLAIRPGTESAAVFGLVNVIIREGLYETGLVRESEGFEAMRSYVEAEFSLESVSETTGIAVERFEHIARELVSLGPAVAMLGDTAMAGPMGFESALAVDHLNALLGAYGREGGIFFTNPPPFAPWPSLPGKPDGEEYSAVESRSLVRDLSEVSDLEVLLIAGTNPVYSLPETLGLAETLAEVPFIASFSSFLDETTNLVDLVLPEPTPFERFDDDVPTFGVAVPMASLSGPIFSRPLYEGMLSMPDVLLKVSAEIGGSVAAAFNWSSYEEALRSAWVGIKASGRGSIVEERESRFWRRALEDGGWWDEDADPSTEFSTENGRYRFELGSIAEVQVLTSSRSEDFPLKLEIYGSVAFGDGRSAHLPFLQELADPMTGVRWGSVVEINPTTAAELDIADGDLVEVISASGQVRAHAFLNKGLHPEAIAVAAGQGHTHYGRFAEGRGVNPFTLISKEISSQNTELGLIVEVKVRKV